ncbi:MAG: hypothetical protein EOS51_18105 [Mesorhizobium sp.]|uniref:DUF6074 family protein n=1 Tax=unclassified Mesorhizobium TaxID=325217 RepID=UPI000FE7F091|nr:MULTISPECIES: DUF6074 family protein [unclassified Mesorhizobium]RWC17043.1 MAG: hypothetical protein EOS51_18105 [Mesorhizobium sp.]TGU01259.1 hypothetical protein EN807_16395 [Mesorhizobium sp. M5C.F.Ca.ET.164.01.1.1]
MKKRHSDHSQLDFFAALDRPVYGEIVIFPTNRMVGLMRAIADELLRIPEWSDRNMRYRQMAKELKSRLEAFGLPPEDIRQQMAALRVGVGCQARKQIILSILHDQQDGAA